MLQKIQMGLAAVMGHEIAHAVAKHSVERASRGAFLKLELNFSIFLLEENYLKLIELLV